MSPLHQHQGLPQQGEAPMLPVEAVAHGMALLQGRRAPRSSDVADAALIIVDLREIGWTVVASPERGAHGERAAALARCLARLAHLADPTPRHRADGEALLSHLHSLSFGLAQCEPGAL